MPTPIRSRQGAEMIEAAVGPVRKCSRQNLDKLCREGALLGSPCIIRAKPLLLDADILLDEYLARVAPFQSEAKQPTAKREQQATKARPSRPPAPDLADDDLDAKPDIDDEKVPNYSDERALHEREKRLIARMERKEKANALLPREELLQAQDAAINITRTVMLGVPSKAKQRIPHLTPDEVAVLLDLIREALQGLASFDVATQYPLREL
jgi:phage terminase Nu1 subunit (DNA packaging protein)